MVKPENIKKEMALLISYSLSSAKGLISEPHLYGALRYLTNMSLIYTFLEEQCGFEDSELSKMIEEIEEIKLLCMTDVDEFIHQIEKLIKEGSDFLKKERIENRKEVILFLLSMIGNARKLIDEPLMHGPWRLLDTVVLFYVMLEEQFGFEDKNLSQVINEVQNVRCLALSNKDAFVQKMDFWILEMVCIVNQYE